jgi:hypothetical protein
MMLVGISCYYSLDSEPHSIYISLMGIRRQFARNLAVSLFIAIALIFILVLLDYAEDKLHGTSNAWPLLASAITLMIAFLCAIIVTFWQRITTYRENR